MIAQVIQRDLADASPFDAYILRSATDVQQRLADPRGHGSQEGHALLDRFYSAVVLGSDYDAVLIAAVRVAMTVARAGCAGLPGIAT